MYPYIAGLVILIVIILYQVYAAEEAFSEAVSNSNKEDTSDLVADASGNVSVAQDASGNEIKLSLSDLFGLLGPFNITKKKEAEKVQPAAAEVQPTPKSLDEIEQRIAKSVAKQVKDELTAQRSTDEVYDKYAPCDLTDAEAQGQEFEKAKPMPQPDMSEYIRKDSIPCWNCSVP